MDIHAVKNDLTQNFDLIFDFDMSALTTEHGHPAFTSPDCVPWNKKLVHYGHWCISNNQNIAFNQLIFNQDKPSDIKMRPVTFRIVSPNEVAIRVLPAEEIDNRIFGNHFDRGFLDAIEDVLLISEAEPLDLPGPRVIFVNDAFEKMTGFHKSEILGRTPRLLQCDNTTLHSRAAIRQGLASWKSFKTVIRNRTKNGREFDVELSISPVADKTGWFTHWISVQRDMTEREQVLNQLTKASVILKSVDMGTWSINPASQRYHWDENCSALHRLPAQVRTSSMHDWAAIMTEKSKTHFEAHMGDVIRTTPATFELTYAIGHGEAEKNIRLTGTTAFDNEGNTSLVGVAIDCTRQVNAEREAEKQRAIAQEQSRLAAIGELAAGMGHEINNPLAVIMAIAEKRVSEINAISPALKNDFSKISTASERIRKIVASTQKIVSKQEHDNERQTLNVDEQISTTLDLVKELYASKGCTINYHKPTSPIFIHASAVAIQQILVNLISNAMDAMLHSTQRLVTIDLALRPDTVTMTIRDTGKGIEEKDKPRIYELFYTSKRASGGTGLGLSITRSLVDAQQGKIWFTSTVGEGTQFYVELKRAQAPSVLPKQVMAPHATSHQRVLLVDDEDMLREVLTVLLESLGHSVVACHNAKEALTLLGEGLVFDTVFTDYTMPDMDGCALITAISERYPNAASHFVLLTGDISVTLSTPRLKRLAPYISEILYKPFTKVQLVDLFVNLKKTPVVLPL